MRSALFCAFCCEIICKTAEIQQFSIMANTPTDSYLRFGEDLDVTFVFPTSGATLLANKFMLSSSSEVFNNLFLSMSGGDQRITIEDISFETFGKMMKYIYGEFKSIISEINEENYLEILYASRKYFINGLTYKVIKFLEGFLNENNLADHFEDIDKFDLLLLKEHVEKLCQKSPLTIIATLTLSESHKRLLKIILKFGTLPCTEMKLYLSIRTMILKNFAEQKKIIWNEENIRNELDKLLYLIRFPTMSVKELICCGFFPSLISARQLVDFLLWVEYKVYTDTLQNFSTIPRKNSGV